MVSLHSDFLTFVSGQTCDETYGLYLLFFRVMALGGGIMDWVGYTEYTVLD